MNVRLWMVAANRPALIQLEVSIVPALKDTNCKWTTPHVKVGLLLGYKAPTQCQAKGLYFLHVTSTVDVIFIHGCHNYLYSTTVLPGNNCSSENRCEQNCVLLEGEDVCSCDVGFSLAENNASCLDVNECNATLAICDQLCNNTNGSFVCDCIKGFLLDTDGRSCIGKLFNKYYYNIHYS